MIKNDPAALGYNNFMKGVRSWFDHVVPPKEKLLSLQAEATASIPLTSCALP